MMKNTKKNEGLCPICGEYMDIRCIGHRNKPFVDGRKYNCICFVCFSVPKTWETKIDDKGEVTFEGPYFDGDHFYTAKEMLEDGVVDDVKRAQKSIKALKKRMKKIK